MSRGTVVLILNLRTRWR